MSLVFFSKSNMKWKKLAKTKIVLKNACMRLSEAKG